MNTKTMSSRLVLPSAPMTQPMTIPCEGTPSCTGSRRCLLTCCAEPTWVRPVGIKSVTALWIWRDATHLEKSHGLDLVFLVESESVVDSMSRRYGDDQICCGSNRQREGPPSWQDYQIPSFHCYSDPFLVGLVCEYAESMEHMVSLSSMSPPPDHSPRTSKNPLPSRIYLISSSSCKCSSKKPLILVSYASPRPSRVTLITSLYL